MPRRSSPQVIKNVVKQAVKRGKEPAEKKRKPITPSDFVSSGSTLLNLALTDHPKCGWRKGRMANIIGDSSSGKTFLAFTAFAEAGGNKRFDDYRLIFDDAEHANSFDMEGLFGKKTADRIEAADYTKDGDDRPSETIEDFHANMRNALKEDDSFIYVLDSMDALDSEDDQKKIEEVHAHREKRLKAEEEGKTIKAITGSYGMSKAKKNSQILRDVCGKLEKHDSILLIISQTRDNIDPMSFVKKTRSGGRALKFYATHEIWTAVGGELKVKDTAIGVVCKVKVSKNKITGKVRYVEFPIYYEYGIDNIGSIIDFLVANGTWTKAKGLSKIDTKGDMGLPAGTRDKLISIIEEEGMEDQLDRYVAEVWHEVEDSLKKNRKKRYA